jgi:hypothetical protein
LFSCLLFLSFDDGSSSCFTKENKDNPYISSTPTHRLRHILEKSRKMPPGPVRYSF